MSLVEIDIDFYPKLSVLAGGFFMLSEDMKVRSLREPLKRSIQQVVAPAFAANFAAEGRPSWEPLADATVMKKKGAGILDESGKLRRKVTQLNAWTFDGLRGEAYVSNLDSLGVGYGYVHQEGAGRTPARPWAMITPQEADKVEEVFGRWIDERVALRLKVTRA
jgi:phage gpG-like protein